MHCSQSFVIGVLGWLWFLVASAPVLTNRSVELLLGFISAVCFLRNQLHCYHFYYYEVFTVDTQSFWEPLLSLLIRMLGEATALSLWPENSIFIFLLAAARSLPWSMFSYTMDHMWELNPLLTQKVPSFRVWIVKDPHLRIHDISWVTPLSISSAAIRLNHTMPNTSWSMCT